jgi:hypothetical protein
MAYERNPNDPVRFHLPDDPYLADPAGDDLRGASRPNDDLKMDQDLAGGPASIGRIAVYIAAAVVLGAVFYGLTYSIVDRPGTVSTAQNAPSIPPTAPPGMRDVTPRANTEPGTTTGAAPAANPPANPAGK